MQANEYHIPVLLNESIDGLKIDPDGIYVDVTFGGGGHSAAILQRLENGRLFAFDQDAEAGENSLNDERFVLINTNFRFIESSLKEHGITQIDGLLADLGVSSHQFDTPERGFSIRHDERLDMRMDRSGRLTAADVLNGYEEKELKHLFAVYGEVEHAGKLAAAIGSARKERPLRHAGELKAIAQRFARKGKENRYFAKVFQALRIEVNDELGALEDMLEQSCRLLKAGGRLVVISYHSLEDRLVKNFMRSGNAGGKAEKDFFGNRLAPFREITRKPIVPDERETERNNRARSAKLRIAEKEDT
ncbi:MAG: 16S rRNA (cytosine(1402)-N(4))-methyltransferase RsmH [Bacteroidota bacterium]